MLFDITSCVVKLNLFLIYLKIKLSYDIGTFFKKRYSIVFVITSLIDDIKTNNIIYLYENLLCNKY